MDSFKEFQGRNLDECITQAKKWFDTQRESLEIEILQDAKTGIFGIVGARKAKIRARRARLAETARDILGRASGSSGAVEQESVSPDASAGQPRPARQGSRPQKRQRPVNARQDEPESRPVQEDEAVSPQAQVQANSPEPVQADAADFFDEDEGTQQAPVNLDPVEFGNRAQEVIKKLAEPIAGREITLHVDLDSGKPRIKIDWEGDAGLLIGRDGQTLAALQYMASRLLSRALGVPLRVQLDIGEYRSRQDSKLRELALMLAERVRQTGKPASTRPLSSYHRRVVHLCLQDEPDIQTRSAGDGVMKRVVILPRRH